MEKKIKNILNILKSTIISVWGVVLLCFVLGENGVFGDWMVDTGSQEEFVLNSVAICLTLFGVPASIKFYNLCTQHSLRRKNMDEAVTSYLKHGLLRNVVLFIIGATDMVLYYITGNIAGGLCALIVLIVSIFCWPKRKQVDEYMEKVNMDEQQ